MTAIPNRAASHWLSPLLYNAYLKARKGKRGTMDEQRFERHADVYLAELLEEIDNRTYRPSRGIAFITRRPVIREIFAAPFRDRIVHHLLFNLVGDWWDRRFIYDNYSCRKGKGTLFAVKRLDHHMRSVSENYTRRAYVLKLDIQGYFMSLPREGLYKTAEWGIRRQFGKESRYYKLCEFLWRQIIFDDPTRGVKIRGSADEWRDLPLSKSLFYARANCGMVIGNLTSQLLSNMYLDKLDRYVTMQLGVKHYGRYVDDFYLVSADKALLLEHRVKIKRFLRDIGLKLHPKKMMLQEISRGIPFLGAVVYPYRIHPGKRIKANLRKAADRYILMGGSSLDLMSPEVINIVSYYGLTQHYLHYKLWGKVLKGDGLQT
jgi:hypothetical protein